MCTSVHPSFFFFHVPATSEIYTLSLHDALPICNEKLADFSATLAPMGARTDQRCSICASNPDVLAAINQILQDKRDRKSTRLNSSHRCISYAVFCLKKKKKHKEKR